MTKPSGDFVPADFVPELEPPDPDRVSLIVTTEAARRQAGGFLYAHGAAAPDGITKPDSAAFGIIDHDRQSLFLWIGRQLWSLMPFLLDATVNPSPDSDYHITVDVDPANPTHYTINVQTPIDPVIASPGGAINPRRDPGAFGTSDFCAVMLGDVVNGESTGAGIFYARADPTLHPSGAIMAAEEGIRRLVRIGGGGFDAPDTTAIEFWTADIATEDHDTAVKKLQIDGSGLTAFDVISTLAVETVDAPDPANYGEGAIYYDLTLHKLRVNGASGWETVNST